MNWQAMGAMGELLGAIAVLATLVYLAVQVRRLIVDSKNDLISKIDDGTRQLRQLFIDHADLIIRANDAEELNEKDKFVLRQIYGSNQSFYFHRYLRSTVAGSDVTVTAENFAGMLNGIPCMLALYRKSSMHSQSRDEVRKFVELVNTALDASGT